MTRLATHLDAGDYSFAFAGLQAGVTVPTPLGIEVDLGIALKQLAISTRGAVDPAVYPNLAFPTFWTPMCVQPGRPLHPEWAACHSCQLPVEGHLHGGPQPPPLWQPSWVSLLSVCLLQGPASPVPERQHVHQWRNLFGRGALR